MQNLLRKGAMCSDKRHWGHFEAYKTITMWRSNPSEGRTALPIKRTWSTNFRMFHPPLIFQRGQRLQRLPSCFFQLAYISCSLAVPSRCALSHAVIAFTLPIVMHDGLRELYWGLSNPHPSPPFSIPFRVLVGRIARPPTCSSKVQCIMQGTGYPTRPCHSFCI